MNRLVAFAPIAGLLLLVAVFAGFLLFRHTPQVSPRAMVGKPAPI